METSTCAPVAELVQLQFRDGCAFSRAMRFGSVAARTEWSADSTSPACGDPVGNTWAQELGRTWNGTNSVGIDGFSTGPGFCQRFGGRWNPGKLGCV